MRRPSRRKFLQGSVALAGLGLLPGCGMLLPQAQAPSKIPRIGYLGLGPRAATGDLADAFVQGLRELGYVEDQTIAIEWRWAECRDERLPALATELVQLNVDIILAGGSPAVRAAKEATSTIPIVIGASNDPVEAGFVTSLARPGGNVTGLSLMAPGLAARRLELLREAVPGVTRVAVLAHPRWVTAERDWDETQGAAQVLLLHAYRLGVERPEAFVGAFETAAKEGAEGLFVFANQFFARERTRIVELAARYRLPVMYEHRTFVGVGGLLSYGPNLGALYRRAAYYVDRILNGAKPADLPVEQPTRFDFIINLRTAQALGLTIPQHVLLQATEVIQ